MSGLPSPPTSSAQSASSFPAGMPSPLQPEGSLEKVEQSKGCARGIYVRRQGVTAMRPLASASPPGDWADSPPRQRCLQRGGLAFKGWSSNKHPQKKQLVVSGVLSQPGFLPGAHSPFVLRLVSGDSSTATEQQLAAVVQPPLVNFFKGTFETLESRRSSVK